MPRNVKSKRTDAVGSKENETASEAANLNETASRAANNEIREKLRMITKTFEPKEMLPFGQLRTLNQKDLLQSLEENDKLGIVIKDQLKVAMIDMEKYQIMVDAVQEYKRLLEWLEERELFERTAHRLDSDRWEEPPEGMSLMDWADIRPKG